MMEVRFGILETSEVKSALEYPNDINFDAIRISSTNQCFDFEIKVYSWREFLVKIKKLILELAEYIAKIDPSGEDLNCIDARFNNLTEIIFVYRRIMAGLEEARGLAELNHKDQTFSAIVKCVNI
jgi:hypothetical protein